MSSRTSRWRRAVAVSGDRRVTVPYRVKAVGDTPLVTITEAAHVFDLSCTSVRRRIRNGIIKAVREKKRGHTVGILPEDMESAFRIELSERLGGSWSVYVAPSADAAPMRFKELTLPDIDLEAVKAGKGVL